MEAHLGKVIGNTKSLLTEDDTHSPKVQTRPDEVPFLEIIEKNADGIIIADCNGVLRYMNPAAESLFERDARAFIGEMFGFPLVGGEKAEIDIFRRQKGPAVVEMRVVDFKWEGRPAYLATLRDITDRKHIEEALNETTRDLEESIRELKKANQQILKQQKKVVEEERLKVLLQMAGATAHELNQPLAILLMNIELLEEEKDIPLRLTPYIDDISESGTRIAQIIKRIQSIRSADAASANRPSAVLNLDQKIEILCLEDSDVDFGALASFFKDQNQITLCRAKTIETGISHAMTGGFDMIFLDFMLPDGTGLDFLKKMQERALETPVVVITGQGDELIASQLIQAGAYDYLPKVSIGRESIYRVISNTMEKYRLRKEVARLITATFRQNDIFGRYGGEEFVVILPNTRIQSARNVCERFREKVAQLVLQHDTYQFQTSISIGLTSLNRAENQSPADLIHKADKALYRAKDQGRNRVEIDLAPP